MRLYSILALTTLLSAPAFAADLGTYRPGSPYHSVVAPGADVCQSHCAGDAQCRGWNYVKVNPRAPGVCEFNSKTASPIESAISISGNGSMSAAPNLVQGRTHTVRVGTSVAPKARAQTRPQVRQVSPTRRVVRQAVPQQIRPQQTVARTPLARGLSLTEQQNNYRRSTGHAKPAPQTRQQAAQPQRQMTREQYMRQQQAARQQQAQRPQVQNPRGPRLMRDPRIAAPQHQPPRFQHNLDGAGRRMTAPQGYPTQAAPQNTGRPPVGVPIGPQARRLQNQRPQAQRPQGPLPRSSATNPVTHQNAGGRQAEAQQRAAYQPALTAEQAQQSLFGSLNDDVRGPKPLLRAPLDPDAPIATAQSRPTQPVTQEQLGALAGPPLPPGG